MQNIDILFVLQPVIVIIICSTLLVYWYRKRHFHASVLLYSLIAYAVAIALKYAVQLPTISYALGYFGEHSIGLGVYYGLQTLFFEVGLAYLFARYAVLHGKIEKKDSEGYGSGLAFWENAGLLGVLSLINLVSYYAILSTNTSLAQTLYDTLNTNAPALFAPASQALKSVAIGTVERVSSILFHIAWGYLCVMSVVYKRKLLFLIALPMGFVDFLVPFAIPGNLLVVEAIIFVLSVLSVIVAWYATKRVREESENAAVQSKS
jgi:hypothetical protein